MGSEIEDKLLIKMTYFSQKWYGYGINMKARMQKISNAMKDLQLFTPISIIQQE